MNTQNVFPVKQAWFSVKDACTYIGKSRSWLMEQITNGRIERRFHGANLTFRRDELDALATSEPSSARRFE